MYRPGLWEVDGPVRPEDIPQELIDIIDERAGKKHSREGRVLTTLAEILTKYDELKERREGLV